MGCFQILKEKGYKLTPQRIMVLDTLHEAKEHITAPEIYSRVRAKYPGINKSTVYRTLELLKEMDLVTETKLGEDSLYYHHVEKGHHHHLVCQKCGKIIDLDEALLLPLKNALRQKHHFEADLKHLAIFGHCLRCKT
jgi:Fur family ferric uptake transcriptional regulator